MPFKINGGCADEALVSERWKLFKVPLWIDHNLKILSLSHFNMKSHQGQIILMRQEVVCWYMSILSWWMEVFQSQLHLMETFI